MILPHVGDLVRLIEIGSDVPYEELLGMVIGYETEGVMAGRAQVVWATAKANVGGPLCYPASRLQVVE